MLPSVSSPFSLRSPFQAEDSRGAALAGAERTSCANCGASLSGHFCAACGAPRLDERPLTVRRFAHDLWSEVTSVDSSTMRSLRALLLAPGRLTREYLDGRTRWYVSPLRLFILLTALHLLSRSGFGLDDRMREETQRSLDARRARKSASVAAAAPSTSAGASVAPAKARRPPTARQRRAERELQRLAADYPGITLAVWRNQWLKLLEPLMLAAMMALVYRRLRRNYAEHVVHAMHLLAFAALLGAVMVPITVFDGSEVAFWSLPVALTLIVLARYTFLSTRTVHGTSVGRSLVDTVLVLGAMQAAVLLSFVVALLGVLAWKLGGVVVRVLV